MMSVLSVWMNMKMGTSFGYFPVLMVRLLHVPMSVLLPNTQGPGTSHTLLPSLSQSLRGPLAHSDPKDLPYLQAACPSGPRG